MSAIILNILKLGWKYKTYIAAGIILLAVYSYGYLQGKDHERDKCTRAIQKIYDDQELQRKKQQGELDKGSTDYQAIKTRTETNLKDIERKYEKIHPIACAANAEFLRLYSEITADRAAETIR